MYGLLTTGFVPKNLEVIRDEINASLRDAFGASLDLSDGSAIGQTVGILAEVYALLWEVAEAVNSSQDPDKATGSALDALAALTGTLRDPAIESTATLTLTGTPLTLVAADSRASVVVTEDEFETLADATIVALTAWATTAAYAIGDRATNASRAYVCTVAGTSAGSGGPTTTSAAEVDGSVTWRYMGEGTGAVDVASQAVDTGPIAAASGGITTIVTPVSGWDSVINLLDATPGRDVESDASLRVRRKLELAAAGTGPINAVRSDLLGVADVTSVTVFNNPADVTDVDGVPPHAFESLVQGGADQDIFDQLLLSTPVGINAFGTTSGTADDDQGVAQPFAFTRPTEIDIYVEITIVKNPITYPADGDDQIKTAIVAFGDLAATGKDAVSSSIGAQAFTVAGVLEVTTTFIGTAPSPTLPTTIAIALRELAVHDTSRITVITSDGTP